MDKQTDSTPSSTDWASNLPKLTNGLSWRQCFKCQAACTSGVFCIVCSSILNEAAYSARVAKLTQAMLNVGVPNQLKDAEMSPSDLSRLEGWSPGNDILIFGPPGVGKSYMAAGLTRRQLTNAARRVPHNVTLWWKMVMFAHSNDVMDNLRSAFNGGTKVDYHAPKFLVFDGFGNDNTSDWVIKTWLNLLEGRKADGKMTVLTTTFNSKDLENKYGTELTDRIRAARTVKLLGKSRRGT